MYFNKIIKYRQDKKIKHRNLRDKRIIKQSPLFDSSWYLNRYPEIRHFPGTPLDHYVEYGAAERRAAGPRFDTSAYLTANPDVAAAGYNPLVHYIRHGEREGRGFSPNSPLSPDRTDARNPASEPVTFSFIVQSGQRSDLDGTIKSMLLLSGAFAEVILPTDHVPAVGDGHAEAKFVRFVSAENEPGRSHIQNSAAAATSEFVIVVGAGDVVTPDALWKLSNFINHHRCDVVYCDEIQSYRKQADHSTYLKPSWSPELLSSFNYFGRLTAIRRTLVLEALASATVDLSTLSAEDAEWDLNLRVAERTQAIARLPEILCHRFRAKDRDLRLPDTAAPGSMAVLKEHWRRRGHDAAISQAPDGTLRSTWPLVARPLVSIVIPNKNRAHLLRTCTDGIYDKTSYRNVELIIVDNGSTEPETLRLYEELTTKSARIIPYDEAFNYSRACNLGASAARGEMLLFLNNDIEVVQANWLDELVRQASEPGVGVVGAKLLYPDGEIQHAGVALGLFTLAAHVFHRAPQGHWGPFGTPDTQRNWTAVTGACQLVRKSLFDLVSGYDEEFIISYSDVVFCLDVARMGFRSVYLPSAVLVHHEGASRGTTNPSADQILFAKRLRSLGFPADPCFHPQLDTVSFEPKLVSRTPSPGPTPMQGDIELLAGPSPRPIDPYDFGAVASAAGVPWESVVWTFDPTHMQPGLKAGTRIVLEFIWRRRDLRRRFPTPIRDGATGGFAHWIKTEGLRLLGLGPDYGPWIDAAFVSDLGSVSRQILLHDPALRREHPLFLLPEGREASCNRLFSALPSGQVTREDIWWFLFATAESAQAALCETWATTPAWQSAVPDGGTVFGVTRLAQWALDLHGVGDDGVFAQEYPALMSDAAQVRLAYAARPEWQERFPDAMTDPAEARALLDHLTTRASGLPFLPRGWVEARRSGTLARDIVRPGVNILAHFAYPSGLRISSESLVEGLRENEVEVSLRDVPVSVASDEPIGHRFGGFEIYGTTLIHIQPEPLFAGVYERAGLSPRDERTYRIGYWYWEFDEIPSSWNWASLQCDEIWTATQFIADGLRARYRQPVHVFTPGIEIPPFVRTSRADFGFSDDAFVFVFVFHMTSIMDRKNPLGLIKAFREAFDGQEKARLVIKTSFGIQHPDSLDLLKKAASGARIDIIDTVFTRDETLSLIEAADAYVSLHRSEGLGLTMAEAMLLGKPVIATGYSGNLDFMDASNSLLVDFRLVRLDRDIAPYKAGQRWAEPSTTHAAQLMRKLFEQPALARDLGTRAQGDLRQRLNYRTTGKAVAERLAEIETLP